MWLCLKCASMAFFMVFVAPIHARHESNPRNREQTLWASSDFGFSNSIYNHEEDRLDSFDQGQFEIPASVQLGFWASSNYSFFVLNTTVISAPKSYLSIEMKQRREQFGIGLETRDCIAYFGCAISLELVSYRVELNMPFPDTNAYIYETRKGLGATMRLIYLFEFGGNFQLPATFFLSTAYVPNRSDFTYSTMPAGDAGKVIIFQVGFAIGVAYNR